jgi:hypothetical protein
MRSIVLLAVSTLLLAAGCAQKDDNATMGTPPADTAPQTMPTEPAPSPTPSETPPPPDATMPPDQSTDPGTTDPGTTPPPPPQ